MSDRSARLQALSQALKERILILDGGMGTMIQSYKLEEADYRGARFADWPSDVKGNNDLLLLSKPQVIAEIERAYLDAGADILETNTFNATRVSQADYGMEALAYEMNVEGARVARQVADAKTLETPDRPRFVAGVLGPTSRTCSISPDVNDPGYRNVTFDELVENYTEATRGLIEGGADLILIETIFDTLNAKAALFAVRQVLDESGLPSRLLELELTESHLLDNVENVITTFQQLRDLGVKLAIDDFGTGYSSLSYLKRFPVDYVKIDQTFVRDLAAGGEDAAITRAIIAMAHGLELKVVA